MVGENCMEKISPYVERLTRMYQDSYQAITAYDQEMKQNPEISRSRTLGLTLALTAIATAGAVFAAKERSLSTAFFTPLVVLYSQESFLIYSLNFDAESDSVQQKLAKDQEKIIRYALVALTFFGAMGVAAHFDGVSRFMIPKFAPVKLAALCSLLSVGTGATLWHEQGMKAGILSD